MNMIDIVCPNCSTALRVGAVVKNIAISSDYATLNVEMTVDIETASVSHTCPVVGFEV